MPPSQVRLHHRRILTYGRCRALERDAPALEDIGAVGEARARRRPSARRAGPSRPRCSSAESRAKISLTEDRRQAERRLVEQQHARPGHEPARHREHLLLAARERAGRVSSSFSRSAGKRAERAFQVRAPRRRRRAGLAARARPASDCRARSGRRRRPVPRAPARCRAVPPTTRAGRRCLDPVERDATGCRDAGRRRWS